MLLEKLYPWGIEIPQPRDFQNQFKIKLLM